jgi:ABC-type nitrate/sulfonate/bicarbonate transport system substrate-binding protein
MVTRQFAERRPEKHERLIAALIESCRFCQAPQNRERLIETLADAQYLDAPVSAIRNSMGGQFDFGHGRVEKLVEFNIFAGNDTNEPDGRKAAWLFNQLTEVYSDPAALDRGQMIGCFRPKTHERALEYLSAAP